MDKVPITLDTVKTAENSCRLYSEHLREENAKKRQKEAERLKHEAHKRKLEEMKAEEKNLHETLKKLKTEHMQAKEAMDRAMGYIDEGRQKINEGLKVNDMMKVEDGQKLIEFKREKQKQTSDWMKYQKRETELKLNFLDFRIARSLKNNSDAFIH